MFTRYANYCKNGSIANVIVWLLGSKSNSKMLGHDTTDAVAYGAIDGWAKNLGKDTKNTINDAAQSAITYDMVMTIIIVVAMVGDALFKAPYFIVTGPGKVLKSVLNFVILTPSDAQRADINPIMFLVYWFFVIALLVKFLFWVF